MSDPAGVQSPHDEKSTATRPWACTCGHDDRPTGARVQELEKAIREADELLAGMWSYNDDSRKALAHTWPVKASDRLREALDAAK